MQGTALISSEINVDKISFSPDLKKTDKGSYMAYCSYDGSPFAWQIPEMENLFGVSSFKNKDGPDSLSITLSMNDNDGKRKSVIDFRNVCDALSDRLKDCAAQNSASWFKKKAGREYWDAFFTPPYKVSMHKDDHGEETNDVDERYPPRFKVNLQRNGPNGGFIVENNQGKKVEIQDEDFKNARVTAILKCSGVWVLNGKYGFMWRVMNLRVIPRNEGQFAFVDFDGTVQSDTELNEEYEIKPSGAKGNGSGLFMSDSDEEA